MKNSIDDVIIKLLFDRNEKALEKIQTEYGQLIKYIAFNLFKNSDVAEECLNDTLLDIWNSIPPNKPVSVSSYASMLARRRAIDRLRREHAEKRIYPGNSAYPDVYGELADIEDVSDTVIDGIELSRHINLFLGGLSGTNREIFISRYFDFEELDSIAKRLRISKNSVNTRLFRMKNAFKKQLSEGGYRDE
ncbi:MAG: sigma-70 family RNA polymerase sigma factor [Clostridia bacterium]|nr:sigma-70 family RNA polymerase sigma factor [Clostridia bacterium]